MLRRMLIVTMVSAALLAGLLAATPTTTAAPVFDNSIGTVSVPDQRWRRLCHDYLMQWTFRPPNDDWQVRAKVRTPKGFPIRTEFWDADSGNKRGQRQGYLRFELCGSSVKPGRYSVHMVMLYNEGREVITRYRKPTYFRLFRPQR